MHIPLLAKNIAVRTVSSALEGTNADVYVVGGAIRDAIMDRRISDIDMVIAGMPLPEVEQLLGKVGRIDVIGRRFAVIRITLPDGPRIDIALPRIDASFGTGRYRDVEVRADPNLPIEEDLSRRDFTINAMAWNIATHDLIDPYNGRDDVKRRTVRCVGIPVERFQEDATRILRAVRFAAQLGFTIEPNTLEGIRNRLQLLNDGFVTPREVIAQELVTGFSVAPARMLDLLHDTGINATLMPELEALRDCEQSTDFHNEGDVWMHTHLALEALMDRSFEKQFNGRLSAQVVFAVLFHDVGKPPTAITHEHEATQQIRFEGHTPRGAGMAEELCTRLKLASTGAIDVPLLVWLIEHHHDYMNIDSMRPATIEKIFLAPDGRGELLQQVIWADDRASLRPEDARKKHHFHEITGHTNLQRRIAEIIKRGYRDREPSPLLTGSEIMELLNVDSGKPVGDIIEALRDAQLDGSVRSRDEAVEFVKTHYVP